MIRFDATDSSRIRSKSYIVEESFAFLINHKILGQHHVQVNSTADRSTSSPTLSANARLSDSPSEREIIDISARTGGVPRDSKELCDDRGLSELKSLYDDIDYDVSVKTGKLEHGTVNIATAERPNVTFFVYRRYLVIDDKASLEGSLPKCAQKERQESP